MRCPGQDTQYWKPGSIYEVDCPKCGHTVEFFKDDTARRCGNCSHRFVNPSLDFGCAAYCQFAEQCLGSLPSELMAGKEDLLKDRVAIEVKRHYRTDFKQIGQATRRARLAEAIGKLENANLGVVLTAALLYDLGSTGGGDPQSTAPGGQSVAEGILKKLGARAALIQAVVAVIETRPENDTTWQIVADADEIARVERICQSRPAEAAESIRQIGRRLKTTGAKAVAQKTFSSSEVTP
jgi:hypothetical protein